MAKTDSLMHDANLKRFGALNIAVMDADAKSAQITRTLLSSLGVYQFRIFRDPKEMLAQLKDTPADVVVADMGMKTEAELEAIYDLRRDGSNIAFTPIIALSAENTLSDVRRLLDIGASELVAKPANIQSVFARMQTIINHPRSFVAAKLFRGPDRRRRTHAKEEGENRVLRSPLIVSPEEFTQGSFDQPTIIMPDFSLKLKMTKASGVLNKEQVENEFLFWVLSDVSALETCELKLSEGAPAAAIIERMCAACLSIKARASVYNYSLGAKVAGLLSDFCRNYYRPKNAHHLVVIEKHIQTLSTVFNQRLDGNGGSAGQELLNELAQLVKKYI